MMKDQRARLSLALALAAALTATPALAQGKGEDRERPRREQVREDQRRPELRRRERKEDEKAREQAWKRREQELKREYEERREALRDRREEDDDRWKDRRDDDRGDEWEDRRDARGAEEGRGPPFCRNGQGHPVHGRRWCEEKGFGRDRVRYDERYEDRDDVYRRGDREGYESRGAYEEEHADFHRWLDRKYSELARERPLDPVWQIRIRADKKAEHDRWHERVGRRH